MTGAAGDGRLGTRGLWRRKSSAWARLVMFDSWLSRAVRLGRPNRQLMSFRIEVWSKRAEWMRGRPNSSAVRPSWKPS
jgi:hypothetical protein